MDIRARLLLQRTVLEDLDTTELSLILDLSVSERELDYVLALGQRVLKENVVMPPIYADVGSRRPVEIGTIEVYHKIIRARDARQ